MIRHMKFSHVLIWRSLESLTKVNVLIFQTRIFCGKAKNAFNGIDDGTAVQELAGKEVTFLSVFIDPRFFVCF